MNLPTKNSFYSSALLNNKLALVTGAGKGIGRQCAASLVEAGARVIAVARTEQDLHSLQAEYPEHIEPWLYDARSEEFIQRLREQQNIDILVNNLGTNKPQPFVDVQQDALETMIDLNFRCVFRITQAVVNNMINNQMTGCIVNITSQMGHVGSPNRSVYCATKHAVEGLTKALGVELASQKIRVNSVAPTFVETPLTKPMLDDPEFMAFVKGNIPMGKIAKTEDIANAVVYLASDLSAMTTGSCLKVDGGWTAQ